MGRIYKFMFYVTAAHVKSIQSDVNVNLFKVNNKNTIAVVLVSYTNVSVVNLNRYLSAEIMIF